MINLEELKEELRELTRHMRKAANQLEIINKEGVRLNVRRGK